MVFPPPRPLKKPHPLEHQVVPHLLQQPQRPLKPPLVVEVGPKVERNLNRPQQKGPATTPQLRLLPRNLGLGQPKLQGTQRVPKAQRLRKLHLRPLLLPQECPLETATNATRRTAANK